MFKKNKREYIFSSRQCQHEAANKSFLGFRRDIKESTIFGDSAI